MIKIAKPGAKPPLSPVARIIRNMALFGPLVTYALWVFVTLDPNLFAAKPYDRALFLAPTAIISMSVGIITLGLEKNQ